MAQAVLPAAFLQDLIQEHKLFQRPEWVRLTDLDRELINTLSRSDMTAGEKKRKYASLTYPYMAVRENVLLNGTKLKPTKNAMHSENSKRLKGVEKYDDKHPQTVPGDTDVEDEDEDSFREMFSDTAESETEEPSVFQEVSEVFSESVTDDLLKTRISEAFEKSGLYGNYLSDDSNSNDAERENIIQKNIADMLQIAKRGVRSVTDQTQMNAAAYVKSYIKLLDRGLYRDLENRYRGFASIPDLSSGVKENESRSLSQGFIVDPKGMDHMLRRERTEEKNKTKNDSTSFTGVHNNDEHPDEHEKNPLQAAVKDLSKKHSSTSVVKQSSPKKSLTAMHGVHKLTSTLGKLVSNKNIERSPVKKSESRSSARQMNNPEKAKNQQEVFNRLNSFRD